MNPLHLLYLLFFLQAADVITTIIALKCPAHKSNKFLKPIMDRIGVVPALVLVKGVLIVYFWYFRASLPAEFLVLVCVFYGWIVYGNVKTIQKGKQ